MTNPIYEINQPDVVYEIIDGEAILINMSTGRYYSLDCSGAVIWEILQQGPVSALKMVQILTARYSADEAQIDLEIRRTLDEMASEGLLRPGQEEAERPDFPPVLAPLPFEAPVLQKYTDLEALLQLDPIHDVSSEGWPNLKTDEK